MPATEYVEKQSRGGRSDNSTCFLQKSNEVASLACMGGKWLLPEPFLGAICEVLLLDREFRW